MAFAFFAGNPFKIFHFRCYNWRSNESDVIQLGDLATALIVLDEQLDILYILELYVTQINRLTSQIFRIQSVSQSVFFFSQWNTIELPLGQCTYAKSCTDCIDSAISKSIVRG